MHSGAARQAGKEHSWVESQSSWFIQAEVFQYPTKCNGLHRKLTWQWKISMFKHVLIGDTSSKGWFSIVMLVFRGGRSNLDLCGELSCEDHRRVSSRIWSLAKASANKIVSSAWWKQSYMMAIDGPWMARGSFWVNYDRSPSWMEIL